MISLIQPPPPPPPPTPTLAKRFKDAHTRTAIRCVQTSKSCCISILLFVFFWSFGRAHVTARSGPTTTGDGPTATMAEEVEAPPPPATTPSRQGCPRLLTHHIRDYLIIEYPVHIYLSCLESREAYVVTEVGKKRVFFTCDERDELRLYLNGQS